MYLVIILFLLITAGLTVVAIENFSNGVSFSLFAWHTPALPVGLMVLLAFFLGALLLYLISVISAWQDSRELKRLQRRVEELQGMIASATASQAPGATVPVPMPGMPPPDISDMPTQH